MPWPRWGVTMHALRAGKRVHSQKSWSVTSTRSYHQALQEAIRCRREYENGPLFQTSRLKSKRLPLATQRRSQPTLAVAVASSKASGRTTKKMTKLYVAQRQSGFPGALWNAKRRAWRVKAGSQKLPAQTVERSFHVANYLKPGVSVEEADQCALQAAVACYKTLTESGQIKKRHRAQRQSGIKGVIWRAKSKISREAWEVRLPLPRKANGKTCRVSKRFCPTGSTAEEVGQARLNAVAFRAEWEKEHAKFVVKSLMK